MTVRYSITVPAYKESGNIEPLTRRVFAALKESGFKAGEAEMIIVDDNSRDGSVEIVEKLRKDGYAVRIDVRTKERGLSSAVIHGLTNSAGEYKLVMDADLQHPPEAVAAMFRALEKPGVQFVCGTRYAPGVAIDKNWPAHRRLISWGARILARPLTPLSDPMSGFFGVRRECYEAGLKEVNPIGYKIALELFVKCGVKQFEEVSFNFATRTFGESKLTGKVIVNYLLHLYALYYYSMGPLLYAAIAAAAAGGLYVAAGLLRLVK